MSKQAELNMDKSRYKIILDESGNLLFLVYRN